MMTSCTCMWPWPGQLRHLVDSGASCSSIFPFQPFSPCIGLCIATHGPPVHACCILLLSNQIPHSWPRLLLDPLCPLSYLTHQLSFTAGTLFALHFCAFSLTPPPFWALMGYGQTSFCPIDRQHHPPSKKRTGYRK